MCGPGVFSSGISICPSAFPLLIRQTLFVPTRLRTDPPRFEIDGVVTVKNTIVSRYSKRVGKVVAINQSRYATTLDKYVVLFDNATETFWDIQLEGVTAATSLNSC
jgi:hypothetical protein